MNLSLIFKRLWIRWFAAIGIALGLTGAIYFFDLYWTHTSQEKETLQWSKQIASQAEGLFLTAKSLRQPDPVGWTAHHLSQGVEPRSFKVSKFVFQPGQKTLTTMPSEGFLARMTRDQMDSDHHIFEYLHVLAPEERTGIQIQVLIPYRGFLGAHSRFASDLYCFALFSIILAFFVLIHFNFKKDTINSTHPDQSLISKTKILNWVQEAKALLTQLGSHVRELIRAAQKLVNSVAQSRESLTHLQSKIKREIGETQEARQYCEESEAVLVGAEAMILNLIIEATRLGNEGQHFLDLAEQLRQLLHKIRKLQQRALSAMSHVENQIQPWANGVEEAIRFYDEIWRATQEMNLQITQTTEALGNQAHHFKSLKSENA